MIRKLWIRFLLVYLGVVLLAIGAASLFAYFQLRSYLVQNLEEELYRTARTIAPLFDLEERGSRLNALLEALNGESGYRVTLIDREGVVLKDSAEDASLAENVLYRPEIQEALKRGTGSAIQHSHTLSASILYCAILVPHEGGPYILRLSVPLAEMSDELWIVRSSLLWGSLLAFLAALPLPVLFSRRLSQRIARITAFVQSAREGDLSSRLYAEFTDDVGVLERELDEAAQEWSDRVEDLASEGKRLKRILEAILDGIIVLDVQDRVVFMNDSACRIIGCREADAIGKRLLEVVRSEELYELVHEARGEPPSREAKEVVLLRDPERTFSGTATTLVGAAGTATGGCILLLRDISEQKQLERVRGDLISRVSHELRTPLTLIKGFVETLQDEGFQDRQQADRYLSVILENTDRLGRLVGDLIRLSSIELGRLPLVVESVQLKELIDRAARSFEVRAKDKGLRLTCDVPEDLPRVMADPDRITEILFNLLDNAIKFTHEGEIRLTAVSQSGESEPAKEASPRGAGTADDGRPQFLYVPSRVGGSVYRVIVTVEDTGLGIPAEELPRVTERFFQGGRQMPEKEKGSGLGLAIVKHLVRRMGGQLSIQSQEGQGTKVKVILPVGRSEESGAGDDASPLTP